MNDMASVIVPRSDQKNADDLLAGPITIKITDVSVRPGTEQPVSVFFDGDEGKPWKPCKSMARVLVTAWGPDSSKYVGRSLTLYCDPKVKWGGMEVGGIRISHMSDIDSAITMALTVTRANKKPFTVQPLKVAPSIQPLSAEVIASHVKAINDAATNESLKAAFTAAYKAANAARDVDALADFETAKDARKAVLTQPQGAQI